MTVHVFPPILEDEPFASVRLYARNLLAALRARGTEVREVSFSRRAQTLIPPSLNGPLNRYLLHPLTAAARQGPLNHVLDHAYGHLGFALNPRRTIISCNSMSIPKAVEGRIPGFRVSRTLRATMWLRHRGMLRCARIVACSQALKQDIVSAFGCNPDRVCVVHDGIDHAVFRRIGDERALQDVLTSYALPRDGTRTILVVSSAGAGGYKNRLGALRTIAVLIGLGYRVAGILVGAALDAGERTFIDRAGLTAHVRSLGRVPDDVLVALYNTVDVFLFPSWDEGFGYPPIEAMACGAPVVVSDIPVLRETTGDAALAAAPDDAEALAAEVACILDNQGLAQRLRDAGLRQAQRYSWERYAEEIIDVYREVAA